MLEIVLESVFEGIIVFEKKKKVKDVCAVMKVMRVSEGFQGFCSGVGVDFLMLGL